MRLRHINIRTYKYMENIEEKIKKILGDLRPGLQADGGDIEFIGWDKKTGVVRVRLLGMCAGCPMAKMTLKEGVETELRKQVPEVKEVAGV